MGADRGTGTALDAAWGLAAVATGAGRRTGEGALRLARPVAGVAAAPARALLAPLAVRGRAARATAARTVRGVLATVVPRVLDSVLDQLDLTDVVLSRVDLDRVVDAVPLDDVVARVDVDRVVERVDVAAVVDRVDLDAVASRLDVDAVVARADLDAVLARLDLGAIVLAVLDEIDLPGIARDLVEEIDLPEIIRSSTGSMASETVRDVRLRGIDADERLNRVVDRLLVRRGRRRTQTTALLHEVAEAIPEQRRTEQVPTEPPAETRGR